MSDTKQTWRLTNLDNGKTVKYDDFSKLEYDCKALINLNRDGHFRITYFEDEIEIEIVELTVYFS
jgi:hypothetical protein